MLKRIDRWWAGAIVFLNGWIFTLPVSDAVPIWFRPIQVVHGVFLHEFLLATYLVCWFFLRGGSVRSSPHGARRISYLIAGLGVLGILSAVVNLRPLIELVGSGRYFLLAAYFLVSIYWMGRHGATFVLRTFLLGVFAGGVVNLYYTFNLSTVYLSVLPRMLGQNGPGGSLGIGILLSAWIMLIRRTSFDVTVAVATTLIGLLGVSISFSRTAMLIAGLGVVGWTFVIFRNLNLRRSRYWAVAILIMLVVAGWRNRETLRDYQEAAERTIELKFRDVTVDSSTKARKQYVLMTVEIMLRNPFFGVSYGGFYEAARTTETYLSGRSAPENRKSGAKRESNPHSSFLYYASANGLTGLVFVSILFFTALSVFWQSQSWRGVGGKALWICFAFGYLIFGLTLPTLFNTSILYLPVAVGLCTTRGGSDHRLRSVTPLLRNKQ